MDLKGKAVLLTGASAGIGRAMALELARRGARLALVARRKEKLDEVASEVSALGGEAAALPADVSVQAQIQGAARAAAERLGGLDVLVNDAAVGYFGALEHMPTEDLERVLRTNVMGPVWAIQAALPALKRSRGMVVNVSSALSKRTLPFLTAYAASKAMLDALSDGMRLELRRYGIRVLTYCPPEVETDFGKSSIRREMAGVELPRRRGAKAEDVARRIVRAIEREKREVVEGASLGWMNFFAPKLVDSIFYKAMVLKLSPKEPPG